MTSLWYPGATRKEIPPGPNDPPITPVMFVVHRSAARGASLYDWFAHGSGGIESHGYTTRVGESEQYRDFYTEADAQSDGNSWLVDGKRLGAISWETEGTADDLWTPKQVAELGRVLTFVHDHIGIPLVVVDSPHPQSLKDGGVGWHSKYLSWNPNVHNCPGDANVATLKLLLPSLNTRPPRKRPTLWQSKVRARPAHWAEDVKALQRGIGVTPDGVWGRTTTKALRAFRLKHKVWPWRTAVAGPAVWRLIDKES
jgi:hypothetical protein